MQCVLCDTLIAMCIVWLSAYMLVNVNGICTCMWINAFSSLDRKCMYLLLLYDELFCLDICDNRDSEFYLWYGELCFAKMCDSDVLLLLYGELCFAFKSLISLTQIVTCDMANYVSPTCVSVIHFLLVIWWTVFHLNVCHDSYWDINL